MIAPTTSFATFAPQFQKLRQVAVVAVGLNMVTILTLDKLPRDAHSAVRRLPYAALQNVAHAELVGRPA